MRDIVLVLIGSVLGVLIYTQSNNPNCTVDRIESNYAVVEYQHNDEVIFFDLPAEVFDFDVSEGDKFFLNIKE